MGKIRLFIGLILAVPSLCFAVRPEPAAPTAEFEVDVLAAGQTLGQSFQSWASRRNQLESVADPSGKEKRADELTYLSPADIDIDTVLAPPPTLGSDEEKKDLSAILAAQSKRTDADFARAKIEEEKSLAAFFGPPLGPLTDGEVVRWSSFFDPLETESHYFLAKVKKHWKRNRPAVSHPAEVKLWPGLKVESGFSYPSGHATTAEVYARVLETIFPEKADAIKKRVAAIGWDRVVAGLHHPTDIQAGIKLGDEIYSKLAKNDAFNSALKKALQNSN
jgi:acid phosphatase (class A)